LSFEEDIGFIDEEYSIPGFCEVEPLQEFAFDEGFDRADINHCQRKEGPV
jgi:hypothetical protein